MTVFCACSDWLLRRRRDAPPARLYLIRQAFFSLVIIWSFFVCSTTVAADSPICPGDYTVYTQDHRYIFVMLVPDDTSGIYNPIGEVNRSQVIRDRYARSGLYRNDGSTMPLWMVDWYAFEVVPFSDGEHLIRWGGPFYPQGDLGCLLAVAFYRQGRELKSYRVNQLVSEPLALLTLPQSVSHYWWLCQSRVDEEQKRLTVETNNYARYTFDVTTGEIVETIKPAPSVDQIVFVGIGLCEFLGFGAILLTVYTWKRTR